MEALLSKLRPVRPKEVAHWEQVLPRAPPDLRVLIEGQIRATARRVLGTDNPDQFLSLPPPGRASGSFHVGDVLYDRPRGAFGLRENELLQNTVVLGRSGSGKTNLTLHLLTQLVQRRVGILFWDYKRTARHLLPLLPASTCVQVFTPGRIPSPLPFTPFLPPPGVEPRVYAHVLVDALSSAYSLGDGSRSLLVRALGDSPSSELPSLDQLLERVRAIPTSGKQGSWRVSALRALESVRFAGLAEERPQSQARFALDLSRSVTVVELDALSQGARRFLVPLLCLWIYHTRLEASDRERLSFVIVLEEAHHVLYGGTGGESTLEMLLRQGRELGLSFVVVDQHPHMLSSAALGNTFTTICLNLKDPRDVRRAAALTGIPTSQSGLLSSLPVGEAIVRLQDRWTEPVRVRIPHLQVPKGKVTDADLTAYMGGSRTLSGLYRASPASAGRVERSTGSASGLSPGELAFVMDVVTYPWDGVDVRYRRLQWSASRGTGVKRSLVARNVLEEQVVARGRTRKHVLRLTEAYHYLDRARKDVSGSVEHEYWKAVWRARLEEFGFVVRAESARERGGATDLLAQRDSVSIAVEVETGKSRAVENVRKDLRAGHDLVIVAATSREAFRVVERQLVLARLLVPPRVCLVLQDDIPLELRDRSDPQPQP